MNNVFDKIKFVLTKPKVVIVSGRGKETAGEAIERVLGPAFGRKVLVFKTDLENIGDFRFVVKNAKQTVFVVTHIGEYHPEKEFFAAEKESLVNIEKLAQGLPAQASLILNFDDETVRDVEQKSRARALTFGFGARADIKGSDVVLTQEPNLGTNFKINYQGNIVPVWLERLFGKEHIYAALAAVAVGEIFDLNLVEISASLKSYPGFPGRMKLIEGIKQTMVLDDSESARPLSMAESLDILKKIEINGRKIAVLGDILGIGEYSPEAHEAIGETAKDACDLLFTVGLRAKFYAEGAKKKGMAQDKIFSFSTTAEAGLALQKELREGDLVLVDGSKELEMAKIVREIEKV